MSGPTIALAIFVSITLLKVSNVYCASSLQDVTNIHARFQSIAAEGEGTYSGSQNVAGHCSLDPLSPIASQPGWIQVGVSQDTYLNSVVCGSCLEINGTGEGVGNDPIQGQYKAVVTDSCSGCNANSLNFATSGDGRWKLNFKVIDCPTLSGQDGKIQFKFQGSSAWYFKLQVRNTIIPIAGIETTVNGRYHCMTREMDNFFTLSKGQYMDVPLRVRLTSITNEQLETTINEIKNDVSISSDKQFSGFDTASDPSKIICFGQGGNAPYPAGGLDPSDPMSTSGVVISTSTVSQAPTSLSTIGSEQRTTKSAPTSDGIDPSSPVPTSGVVISKYTVSQAPTSLSTIGSEQRTTKSAPTSDGIDPSSPIPTSGVVISKYTVSQAPTSLSTIGSEQRTTKSAPTSDGIDPSSPIPTSGVVISKYTVSQAPTSLSTIGSEQRTTKSAPTSDGIDPSSPIPTSGVVISKYTVSQAPTSLSTIGSEQRTTKSAPTSDGIDPSSPIPTSGVVISKYTVSQAPTSPSAPPTQAPGPVSGELQKVLNFHARYKSVSAEGDGTYYGDQNGGGYCSLNPLSPIASQPGWIQVAVSPDTYLNSIACGACLLISGTGQGLGNNPIEGQYQAVVTDSCPGCYANSLDFATSGDGRWKLTFKAIDCPTLSGQDGKIQFKFQGSNSWYFKIQVRNAIIPAAGMEATVNGKYHCMKREADNFFSLGNMGEMDVPLRVRLTSITNEQIETTINEIKNGVSISSNIQFSGFDQASDPGTILCFGQGDSAPYPADGLDPSGPVPTSGEVSSPPGISQAPTSLSIPVSEQISTAAAPTQTPGPVSGELQKVLNFHARYKSISAKGDGTYYGDQNGGGYCSLNPLSPIASQPGWIQVAVSPDTYLNSIACGACLLIYGSGQGLGNDPIEGLYKAVVTDSCPGCYANSLDFAKSGDGRWKLTFKAIDCPTLSGQDGKIQFKFEGSNPWYFKIQVRNAIIPAAGMEATVNGKYHCMKREADNFFTLGNMGEMDVPLRVRLTSITNEQIETTINEIKNGVSISSDIQFSGFDQASDPHNIVCFGQGDSAPYPPDGLDPVTPLPTSGTAQTPPESGVSKLRCYSCHSTDGCRDKTGNSSSCPGTGSSVCLRSSTKKNGVEKTLRSCSTKALCEQVKTECERMKESSEDVECDVLCCNIDLCNAASVFSFNSLTIVLSLLGLMGRLCL